MKSLGLAVLILGVALAASPSASETGPRAQVNAILKACRDNPNDRSFRAAIGCEGTEPDPAAAEEDMDALQPVICQKLDRQCGDPRTRTRASDLANALQCAASTMTICQVNSPGGGVYDLCEGRARLTKFDVYRNRVLVVRLETKKGGQAQIPVHLDELRPQSGALQRWMRANTTEGGTPPPDATLSAFKAYLGQHCSEWVDPAPGSVSLIDLVGGQIRAWVQKEVLHEDPQHPDHEHREGGGVRG